MFTAAKRALKDCIVGQLDGNGKSFLKSFEYPKLIVAALAYIGEKSRGILSPGGI